MPRSVVPACGLIALVFAAGCGSKPDSSSILLTEEERQKLSTAEQVDNPQFAQWAAFPVGTTLTRRMTTDSTKSEGQTVTTFVFRITEKSADVVVVESTATTRYHSGQEQVNPPVLDRYPRTIALPNGVKKDEWGKPKGGTIEGVIVLGKTYAARKSESRGHTDAGELFQQVWVSDDIPGGLVKSVQRVPKVDETTTIEIVELTVPQ